MHQDHHANDGDLFVHLYHDITVFTWLSPTPEKNTIYFIRNITHDQPIFLT